MGSWCVVVAILMMPQGGMLLADSLKLDPYVGSTDEGPIMIDLDHEYDVTLPKVDVRIYSCYLYHYDRAQLGGASQTSAYIPCWYSSKPPRYEDNDPFIWATFYLKPDVDRHVLEDIGEVQLFLRDKAEIEFPLRNLIDISLLPFVDSIDHRLKPRAELHEKELLWLPQGESSGCFGSIHVYYGIESPENICEIHLIDFDSGFLRRAITHSFFSDNEHEFLAIDSIQCGSYMLNCLCDTLLNRRITIDSAVVKEIHLQHK